MFIFYFYHNRSSRPDKYKFLSDSHYASLLPVKCSIVFVHQTQMNMLAIHISQRFVPELYGAPYVLFMQGARENAFGSPFVRPSVSCLNCN